MNASAKRAGRPGCRFLALLGLALLAACASGPRPEAGFGIDAVVDPAHADTRYDGFIVYAAFDDPGLRMRYERALCARLNAAGHACTTMIAAAPPTREQNAASRHAATRNSGAQATLLVELADSTGAARRQLAGGRPGYEIRVIDNGAQSVAQLITVAGRGDGSVSQRSSALAAAVVAGLRSGSLLYERR